MFDAGLGPHSITLICCGFVVQLTDATTTVEMYSRTGIATSTTSCTTNPQEIWTIELQPTYRVI